MAKTREATSMQLWICPEGHLHVSLFDERDNEIATCSLDGEDTQMVVISLADDVIDYYDLYEEAEPDAVVDTIGPTMGNA